MEASAIGTAAASAIFHTDPSFTATVFAGQPVGST